ncbi:MAG: hypothetical protein AVDCRST_MAG17-134, partial [uncultured Solirubrobacterales bacterium]
GQADRVGAGRGCRCAGVQPAPRGQAVSQDEADV